MSRIDDIRAQAKRKRAYLKRENTLHGTSDFELEDVEYLLEEVDRLRNQHDANLRHLRRLMDTVELERARADRAQEQLAARDQEERVTGTVVFTYSDSPPHGRVEYVATPSRWQRFDGQDDDETLTLREVAGLD